MGIMTENHMSATEYANQRAAYYTPSQPFIKATEVLAETEARCGAGQQYATFSEQISDEEKAKVEAKGYTVTRNYVQSKNRDGAPAPDEGMYVGFQVALNATAATGHRPMQISERESNGISGGGDVDQIYDPTSENAQSGTAVAQALQTIPSVTVDQTYDADSTNPQSGTAVAQVIATKPGEITTGKQYVIDGQTVTAATGAEAFNDLANNKASGQYSHAEGSGTTASGGSSHAEGANTKASGQLSHAEGSATVASGGAGHAEGVGTVASGNFSHAEGFFTIAASAYQHVQGKLNEEDADDKFAFIIGNGTTNNDRHNAFAVDWNGLIYVNGAATGVDVAALAATIGDINAVLEEVL